MEGGAYSKSLVMSSCLALCLKTPIYIYIYMMAKSGRCLLLQAEPYDNLRDVAWKILEFDVATVPVIQSSSQDGSYPQLLHLASLSEILKCKFFA